MLDLWKPTLEGLPDELLQGVFEYLQPKRWSPLLGDNSRPCGRDDEDRNRNAALGAICQTSKRFLRIATPLFYADVQITAEGPTACDQMTRLFKTLATHPESANHVTSIHIPRLMSALPELSSEEALVLKESFESQQTVLLETIWNAHTIELWKGRFMESPQQAQLSLLLWLTPNLSQLTLGTSDESLSRLLGLGFCTNASTFHHYRKLETLELYTDIHEISQEAFILNLQYPTTARHRLSPFGHSPLLRRYIRLAASGAQDALDSSPSLRGAFRDHRLQNLQTLHLIGCRLRIEEVVGTVASCNILREFRYRPRWMQDSNTLLNLQPLCNALLQNKDTLRYLYLSLGAREGEIFYFDYIYPEVGCFRQFDKLHTLVVPVCVLMGRPVDNVDGTLQQFKFHSPMSQYLPGGVTILGLSDEHALFGREQEHQRDLTAEVAELLVGVLGDLPCLRAVHMLHSVPFPRTGGYPILEERCIDEDIEFVDHVGLGDMELLARYHRTLA
jgi:hypothetical protein